MTENGVSSAETAALLRRIADDPELLGAAHLAIEDRLIEMRDSGMFLGGPTGLPANGFTVRERDGRPSNVIRFGTRFGVELALRAIAEHIEASADRSQSVKNGEETS